MDEATDVLNAVFEDIGLDADDIQTLVSIVARLRKSSGDFRDPTPLPDPL